MDPGVPTGEKWSTPNSLIWTLLQCHLLGTVRPESDALTRRAHTHEADMTTTRDWNRNRDMWIRVLEKQTGEDVEVWNRRIAKQDLRDERSLRAWLRKQNVTGYAQSLLVMERFGYPDFVLATADQLIARQYADRPELRPIYDALVRAAARCGDVIIQARKTYVSLVSPRRTFARVQPTTRRRVDLGLRLEGRRAGGRLQPCTIHETMPLQVGLTAPDEVNDEVQRWLQQAYAENS